MEKVLTLLRDSGAMLEGHFLLSSGRHSDRYFQCAKLLQYPDRAASALAGVAERIKSDIQAGKLKIDAVVGPAMGGIIVAYELGRQLGVPALFTERDDTGTMVLRRGFEVQAGQKILITEDVVTTGKSYGECAAALEGLGAQIAALACIVDRRHARNLHGEAVWANEATRRSPNEVTSENEGGFALANPVGGCIEVPWPFYPACSVDVANWEADSCDLCKKGIPAIKPGSRKT